MHGDQVTRLIRVERGVADVLRRLDRLKLGAGQVDQEIREAWTTLPGGVPFSSGPTLFSCAPCSIPEATLTATFVVPGVGTTTENLAYCPNGLVSDSVPTVILGRPAWISSCFRVTGSTTWLTGWYYVALACFVTRGGTTGSATTYKAVIMRYSDGQWGGSAGAQAKCSSDNSAVCSPGVGGTTSGIAQFVYDHYTTAPVCSPFFVTLWDASATISIDISA